jgi:protein-disulfide isomerase
MSLDKNTLLLLSCVWLFACTKPGNNQTIDVQPVAVKAEPNVPWWQPLLPDQYLARLTSDQKKEYEYITNELLCPCGEHTEVFAACIEERRCPEALQAANMAARLLGENTPRGTVEALVAESYGSAPVKLSIQDAPILGDENAPVTIVDFADFQCPYCAKLAVELHQVVASRPKDVRLVYKYFPIPAHPYAYLSAEAAAFAQSKNKFWELHDILFARQKTMTREEILNWASEIGLDADALDAAWQQSTYAARVKRDEAEGDALKVEGTPTLYINGRIYNEGLSAKSLSRAIDEALWAQKAEKSE